jgi:radical SAM superfamily enzyme YgiQ (UPF0313 family)
VDKKRVMLVMPPNVTAIEPFRSRSKVPQPIVPGFPMGLGYIASWLRREGGYDVRLVDGVTENLELDDICRIVREYDPHYIGMTLYTRTVKVAVELARRIRDEFPGKIVIGGGPHASDDHANLMARYPFFDYLVVGEGEVTMSELLGALDAGRTDLLHGIRGLAFLDRATGGAVFTGERPLSSDIDAFPHPARDLVDYSKYIVNENQLPLAVEVMGSRGCSHRCAFCSFQRKWRARSPEAIVAELRSLVASHPKTRSFLFFDDNFSVSEKRVIALCQAFIESGLNKYTWSCLCRADQMTPDMVGWMRKAGCARVLFGVESGCPEILERLNKRMDLDKVVKSTELVTRGGIDVCAFFIIGSPGETLETIRRSVAFAKRLACQSTQWGIMQVYPGTKLAELQPCDDFVSYLYEPEVEVAGADGLSANIPAFENPGLDRKTVQSVYRKVSNEMIMHKALTHPLFALKKILGNPSIFANYAAELARGLRSGRAG